MFKVTRSTIVSGVVVAFITSMSTAIYTKSSVLDKHEVRISHLEKFETQSELEVRVLASEVSTLRVESATVVTMLNTLSQTNEQLSKTTTELGKIVARLDERTKH